MITPTPTVTQFAAKVNSEDLATLIGAVATAGVITLPAGKTLADVAQLTLTVYPTPQQDGTAADLRGAIK